MLERQMEKKITTQQRSRIDMQSVILSSLFLNAKCSQS